MKRTDQKHLQCAFEIKEVSDDAANMTFSGYGAVFGNVDSYGDVIQAGAFAATLRHMKTTGIWAAMLLQHGGWGINADDMNPIGIWTSLEEDEKGLKVEGKLAGTPRGIEMYTLMKMKPRPAIDGLSIGYTPIRWKNRVNADEPRRTLEEVKLWEISPVTFPANDQARASAKAEIAMRKRIAETALRDAGCSVAKAKAAVALAFAGEEDLRDEGDLACNANDLHELAAEMRRIEQLFKGN